MNQWVRSVQFTMKKMYKPCSISTLPHFICPFFPSYSVSLALKQCNCLPRCFTKGGNGWKKSAIISKLLIKIKTTICVSHTHTPWLSFPQWSQMNFIWDHCFISEALVVLIDLIIKSSMQPVRVCVWCGCVCLLVWKREIMQWSWLTLISLV